MKKYRRKIVKDRKDKDYFSINLPFDFVKDLGLQDAIVDLEIVGDTGVIRKICNIEPTKQGNSMSTGKKKPYDLGDEIY